MMRTSALRLGLLVAVCAPVGLLTACTRDPLLKEITPPPMHGEGPGPGLTVNKDVDILFVIDNSGSMGEEQATLAANFASFIEVLERPEVAANYRIGVTTTDNSNPWCGSTGPEAGALRLTSCLSRPTEFVFNGATTVDVFAEACEAVCPPEWTDIEVQPSDIAGDPEAKARPWLESIDGKTNLPDGLDTVQAFQCFGPQGVDGCGYESHLESMWKALRRSQTDGDEAYGFIRNNAILSIVHVTDEADCSYNRDHEVIFLPEGNRVFWSDPDMASPTSAVCWNAGVECDGTECYAVDLDEDGTEVSDSTADADAVLHPLERYIDIVQTLENQKQTITPDQEVLVSVIGGVASDGSVVYQDAVDDPVFQQDFGIGPGCESSNGRAVPPVRLRELAGQFQVGSQRNMFSICDSNYSEALEAVASAIASQIKPACYPACTADTNPDTPDVLDPSCVLTQEAPQADGSFETIEISPCEADQTPPDGTDVCYVALTGDARNEFCIDQGFNLEFQVVRRKGVPAPGGTSISAVCELSDDKATDCPDLP